MRKRHKEHPDETSPRESSNLAAFYKSQGIHPKWAKCRIDDFSGTSIHAPLKRYLADFEKYYKDGKGLFVSGDSGTGKSHIVFALYHHFLINTPFDARVVFFDTLLSKMFLSWKNPADKISFNNAFKKPKILMIEDFGKELVKNDKSSPSKVIELVVKTRAMMAKPTIITSNLDPSDIGAEYGSELASLMREYFFPVSLDGFTDRRVAQRL